MGASPSTKAQPDYKAILQGFYDKQLVIRIAQAHKDAFTDTNRPMQYAEQCMKCFNAFAAICQQFSNQEKFGEVYGREDYLQPVLDFKTYLANEKTRTSEDFEERILQMVSSTLAELNPSQTAVSDK